MISSLRRKLSRIFEDIFIIRRKPKYSRAVLPSGAVLNGVVCYNEYGGYFTPLSSQQRPAIQALFKGEVFEPDTIKFLRENCGEGDIIHAGVFFGDFLPGLSGALSGTAKVWAFEPNPENYRCAQITCLINGLGNIHLTNAGLGEKKETTSMLVESEAGVSLGGASKILKDDQKGRTLDVSIVRTDDVIPTDRRIAVLQLDVEGYEKEALNGGLETIKRCKPILILEDNDKIIDSAWFTENIRAIGYEVRGKIHDNTLLTIKER